MEKTNFTISPNITQEQLIKYGFHRIYPSQYVYRVPCYKYKKQPLIFLEFTVIYEVSSKREFENPTMLINCRDKNDNLYAPFYGEYFQNNLVLDKVNKKLALILSDMIKKEIVIKTKKNYKTKKRRKSK